MCLPPYVTLSVGRVCVSWVVSQFFLSKRPSLKLLDSLTRQLYSHINSAHNKVRKQVLNWQECRHCSWLLSGDDWQWFIGTSVGIAVCHLQAVNLLEETNNGWLSLAMPNSGLRLNQIRFLFRSSMEKKEILTPPLPKKNCKILGSIYFPSIFDFQVVLMENQLWLYRFIPHSF